MRYVTISAKATHSPYRRTNFAPAQPHPANWGWHRDEGSPPSSRTEGRASATRARPETQELCVRPLLRAIRRGGLAWIPQLEAAPGCRGGWLAFDR